jgi:hypothetical protein
MRFIWIIGLMLIDSVRLVASAAATNSLLDSPISVRVTGMLTCNENQMWSAESQEGIGYRLHSVERHFVGGEEVSRQVTVNRMNLKEHAVSWLSVGTPSTVSVFSRFDNYPKEIKPIWSSPWGPSPQGTGNNHFLSTNESIEVRARLKRSFTISDTKATSVLEAVWRRNGEVIRMDTLALSAFKIKTAPVVKADETLNLLEPLPKDSNILYSSGEPPRVLKNQSDGLRAPSARQDDSEQK